MDDHASDRLAIAVEGLHEIFRVYHERPPGLKERLYRFRRSSYTDFHALRDVSLRVRHGECVALGTIADIVAERPHLAGRGLEEVFLALTGDGT